MTIDSNINNRFTPPPKVAESREKVLQELAKLQSEIKKDSSVIHYVKITRDKEGLWNLVHTEKQTSGIWNKFVNKFHTLLFGPTHMDDLKEAHLFYEEVRANVGQKAGDEKFRETVQGSFNALKALYENHRSEKSAEEQVYKNDILDSLASAYGSRSETMDAYIRNEFNHSPNLQEMLRHPEIGRMIEITDQTVLNEIIKNEFRGFSPTLQEIRNHPVLKNIVKLGDLNLNNLLNLKIGRVAADRLPYLGQTLKSYEIPLFRSEDLPLVNAIFEEKFAHRTPTLDQIKEHPVLKDLIEITEIGRILILRDYPDRSPTLKEMMSNPLLAGEITIKDPEKVKAIVKRDFATPTMQEIQSDARLNGLLVKEDVALGWLVERIYAHKTGVLLNNRIINWGITTWMGFKTKREMEAGAARTEKVVKFFNQMHIAVSSPIDGLLFSYRELHGRDVRDEKSLDQAFQRPLTPDAVSTLMRDANDLKNEIQGVCGDTSVAPVICNAFSRVRVLNVGAGKVDEKFSITGKVLDQEQESTEEVSYGGQFKFSIKNMLGGNPNVGKVKTQADAEALQRSVLSSAMNQKDLTMVVQRLAPADIHHYGMSVGGEILSLKQSCEVLKGMMAKSTNPTEAAQLNELIAWYESQEGSEFADKALSEIKGGRESVSTLATKSKTPLSENDRKVMMVRHEDNTISVHVFIGAVGVNYVKVDAEAGKYAGGADLGSMGFGDDPNRDQFSTAKTTKAAPAEESIFPAVGANQQVGTGETTGSFALGGSTVISLFFREDFVPTEEMSTTTSAVTFKDQKGEMSNNIEILAPWGKPIALPTLFVALKNLDIENKPGKSPDQIMSDYFSRSHTLENPDKEVMERLYKEFLSWKENPYTVDPGPLLGKVIAAIEKKNQ